MYTKEHFEKILALAKEKQMLVRVFYTQFESAEAAKRVLGTAEHRTWGIGQWAVEGIPEIYEDHVIFPTGSLEVLETGDLAKPSRVAQKRAGPQLIPYSRVTILELSLQHN